MIKTFQPTKKTTNDLVKDLLMFHGNLSLDDIVTAEAIAPFEVRVELANGVVGVYDATTKMFCRIRKGEVITDEEWQREFGRRLNRSLLRAMMTQEDLANAIGVSRQMIVKYINGQAIPSAFNISKIAKALNCSSAELIEID